MIHVVYRWASLVFLLLAGAIAYAAYTAYAELDVDLSNRPVAKWQPEANDLKVDSSAGDSAQLDSAVTRERPLFSPTRRPFVPAPPEQQVAVDEPPPVEEAPPPDEAPAPAPEQVFDPGQFALKGVLAINGSKRVLVASPEKADGQWMIQGDEINGWKISEIGNSFIKLHHGTSDFTLKQYVDNSPAGLGSETPSE